MDERLHDESAGHGRSEHAPEPYAPAARTSLQADVLQLQRTVGNRAVGRLAPRLLARQPATAAAAAGSKLVGRRRTLTWDDFTGTPDAKSPHEAQTKTTIDIKVDGKRPGTASFESANGSFKLKDKVVITVDLDRKQCWKKESIDNAGATQQRLMLDHEQGHYDIAALSARDLFLEIMALKPRTFATAQDGFQELEALITGGGALLRSIDALYDSVGETGHRAIEHFSIGPPRKPAAQARWEGFIRTAFTQERTPQVTAPDGATYKVTLAGVLRAAGHKL
jgi:hypothetical protein